MGPDLYPIVPAGSVEWLAARAKQRNGKLSSADNVCMCAY